MGFLPDVRLALRRLRSSPGFAFVAIATLALGIGANTAVFSLVNRILFRPLPVARPAELSALNAQQGQGIDPTFSYPNYKDLRDRNTVFSSLVAYRIAPMALSRGAANRRLWGYLVTGNYFETLGVHALLGRTLVPADDVHAGAHPVIVISYSCWQRDFAGDRNIAGATARLNGMDYTILGVLPRGFTGTELFYAADVYAPMAMARQIEPGSNWIESRRAGVLFLLGRRKPDVTAARAESALNGLAAALGREYPVDDEGLKIRLSPPGLAGMFLRGPVIGFTGVLLAVTGLVLLIACTNLAGLLLARASDRRREIGICLALGAGRARMVRQMLTESLVLAVAGGAAGLLLARWLMDLVAAWHPPIEFPLDFTSAIDFRVLLFTCAVVIGAAMLFGLAPALQTTRTDLVLALKNAGHRGRRWTLRDAVVALQVTLSVVLLAGSVLVLHSLQNALTLRLGFEPRGLAMVRFDLSLHGYNEARGREFQRRLFENVRALPGIEIAALTDRVPLGLDFNTSGVYVEGKPEPKASSVPNVYTYDAGPGYFRAMGTRLVAGREFDTRDVAKAPRVAVVNQAFADQLLPGEQPLGRRFRFSPKGEWRTIVGIVETGKQFTLGETAERAVWDSLEQDYSSNTAIVARSSQPEERTLQSLRAAVLALDPGITFFEAGSMADHLRLPLFPARAAASALAAFGAIALLLAAIGIYGLMAYAVARRTREFGIRLALGAGSRNILGSALVRAAVLLAIGLAAGIAAAAALAPFYSAILYNVRPRDPLTLGTAAGLIVAVGVAASLVPALRALHIDPSRALREE